MGEKETDDIKKEIEKEIEESLNHSKDESFRESFGHGVTKVQRPDQWPEPPDEDTDD
jgi:hypothetical protein